MARSGSHSKAVQAGDIEGGRDIAVKITFQVASHLGVTVNELDNPLNQSINADALSKLFRDDTLAELSFEWNGCWVTVNNHEEVTVEDL